MNEPSIVPLIQEFLQQSPEAAEELWRRFCPNVMRVVRRHLGRRVRRVSDTQDFVQAVWKSIFEHRERLLEMKSSTALATYLARVAANKVLSAARSETAHKRDARRTENGGPSVLEQISASDPSPSEQVIAIETEELLVKDLNTIHRHAIQLRIAGNSIDEIASQLGINERTVRRVFERVAQRRT